MVNESLVLYRKCCDDLRATPDPHVIGTLKTHSSRLECRKDLEGSHSLWLALVELLLSSVDANTGCATPASKKAIGGPKRAASAERAEPARKQGHSLRTQPVSDMPPIEYLDATAYGCSGMNGGNLLKPLLVCYPHLVHLNLCHSMIEESGARQIAEGLVQNRSLKTLILEGNFLGLGGAEALAEGLMSAKETTALQLLDINNTGSTFHGVVKVEDSVVAINEFRTTAAGLGASPKSYFGEAIIYPLVAHTDRNFTTEEIANSISHGFATVLTLFGACLLLPKASQKGEAAFLACFVFICSMLLCYLSSTLYHSMYMLKRTQKIFHVLDHSAIYLLIAGTYTPVVVINMRDMPGSMWLLVFQWAAAFIGITTKALLTTPFGVSAFEKYQLILYAGMGWAAVFVLPNVLDQPPFFRNAIALGGLFYTGGIYFFVRGNVWPMYHAVWHLFTMAGGLCHFLAVYSTVNDA